MYQARILDKNRQLKAILPGVHWRYVRRRNETTDVEVYIPRETVEEHIPKGHELYGFFAAQPFTVETEPRRTRENKARYAEIAAFIQIWQIDESKLASDPQASVVDPTFPALNLQAFDISTASTRKVTGKIISRNVGPVAVVKALTEEILLETNVTPAQYGRVWEGWDLADLVRDNLDGWHTLRVKASEQWQARLVASSNVDLTTDPGIVMLAKRSDGRYYDSGYIVLLFDPSEVPHFKQWDRMRWSADSDGALSSGDASPVVQTTVQWSADGSTWSAPWDGGFPEEVGLVPGVTSEPLYMRINLITNDTESEDANGEPVGVTPYVFACEAIARTHGELIAGEIPDVAGVTVGGINGNRAPSLAVVQSACAQAEWEFEVVNGAVHLAQHLGTDRSSDILLRAGTNMEVASLGDDDDELVNILTAQGPGSGINRMEITLRDEASIAEYGPYPNREPVEFEVETLTELMQKAQEYLDTHNTPATHFAVSVAFPHDKEPEYGIGDTVKVVDPETGIVTTARILEDQREYSDSGLSVLLELGKAGVDITNALDGRKPPKKPVDPMQPSGVWARGIVKGVRIGFTPPKGDWDRTEVHLSTASNFLPSSGTLRDSGKQAQFDVPGLEPGTRYFIRTVNIGAGDRRSEPSAEVSAIPITRQEEDLKDYQDGTDDYVKGLNPVILVSTLPELPDHRFPVESIVFLTSDEKLYRNDNGAWELLVNVNLESLEGQITETQISDDSISTPKLQAEAITSAKIAAHAITADKIAVNSVTAGAIQAGAVSASHIAAETITADRIVAKGITDRVVVTASNTVTTTSSSFNQIPDMIASITPDLDSVILVQTGCRITGRFLMRVDVWGDEWGADGRLVYRYSHAEVKLQERINGGSWQDVVSELNDGEREDPNNSRCQGTFLYSRDAEAGSTYEYRLVWRRSSSRSGWLGSAAPITARARTLAIANFKR